MNFRIRLGFTLIVLGVLLALVQLGSGWFARDFFVELEIANGALFMLLVVWNFVARERGGRTACDVRTGQ